MFDEVGNDSVMSQACFVYTVRDLFQWTPEPGPDLVGSWAIYSKVHVYTFRLCGLQENHHGIVSWEE